jgi:radical SAM-linked protein
MTERVRLRIRFSKLGKIRWTSHRDVARMWERAFRRVQLPLCYSEGFSPRPRVSFGLALPTGHESVAEYLDVELSDLNSVDLPTLAPRLSDALPVGVDAMAISILERGVPSLQEDVTSCSWRWLAAPVEGHEPPTVDQVGERIETVLSAPTLVVARNRKGVESPEDIRPGIEELKMVDPPNQAPAAGRNAVTGIDQPGVVWLEAELTAQPRSVRPAEVMIALGPGLEERDVRRTHQWILRHGARLEPLAGTAPANATEAPHALERAS